MDITLSEEQQMLRQTARDFLIQKCPKSLVRDMDEMWGEKGRARARLKKDS